MISARIVEGVAAAAIAAGLLAAVPAAGAEPALAAVGVGGEVTRVVAAARGWRLERRDSGGALRWSHPLPSRPRFLQAGAAAGTAVTGELEGSGRRWAVVATEGGRLWQVPGRPILVHLSRGGERVMAQATAGGALRTRVYSAAGALLADLPADASQDRVTRLSLAGDAVLVSGSGSAPDDELVLLEVATGRRVRRVAEEAVEDAVALDAGRVLTLGAGSLRLLSLAGDPGERPAASWTVRPPRGYWTLLGVSDRGERILVSREGGWDVLDGAGEVVFRLDHGAPGLRGALGGDDLRGLEPRLLGGGDLLLEDRNSPRRWVVRLTPGGAAPGAVPVPPGAAIDAGGRWALAPGSDRAVRIEHDRRLVEPRK